MALLRPGQRVVLAMLAALRTAVGVCDLVFAGAMYQLFTLLQGGSSGVSSRWVPHTVTSACLLTGALVLLRLVLDLFATRAVVEHIQKLYADLLLRLARGYSEMRWNAFLQRNRSEMLKHAIHTALDAAFFYQLLVEGVAGLVIALLLTLALGVRSPLVLAGLAVLSCALWWLNRSALRERLASSGAERERAGRLLQRTFSEALAAGKELRVRRNHFFFEDVLRAEAARLGRSNMQLAFLPQLSRLVAEQGVVLLFLATLVLVQLRGGDVRQLLSLLVFYFVLSRRLLPALSQLALSAGQLQGAYENVSVIAAELRACRDDRAAAPQPQPPSSGIMLEIEDLVFGFEDGRQILRGARLHVAAGEVVLLQGPSGIGKSSVLNLVAGLLDPAAGSLRLDRSRLAYVPQEVTFFDASVRTNLLFGAAHRPDDAIWRALEQVGLAAHVAGLAQGLDTPVGDGGLLFSGGERQRLGLARALLQGATLLLLDEATSGIDEATELQILRRLAGLDLAILMVSHRTDAGLYAHRTYRLEGGLLRESSSRNSVAARA